MGSLVLWEVSKKQAYIFSSNRLKENIGASIIVEKLVEELPTSVDSLYEDNLIYNGGGSSLYNFESNERARDFIKNISRRILEDYPGVEVFMTIVDYDEEEDKLTDKMDEAYRSLEVKKNRRLYSGRQVSFGIERKCYSTGNPAVDTEIDGEDKQKRYISEDIALKLKYSDGRNKKFKKLLPDKEMTKGFRDMASGEKNYMAVVHIDGNKMGQKFEKLREEFIYTKGSYKKTNKEYLRALKIFSDNIKNAYEDAFIAMSLALEKNKEILKDDTGIEEDKFPLIPIIVAGDDITYVTNGKLGIETARIFLEHLYKNEVEIYDGNTTKLNACAGVAIVRTSHPFKKAYTLAEELCDNAKKTLRIEHPNSDYSLIDWHIEQSDIVGNIEEIREKSYKTVEEEAKLFMRPLYLNLADKKEWKTYDGFKEALNNLNHMEINSKKLARNKIKELREILNKGKSETELFLKSNDIVNFFPRFPYTNEDAEYCFNEDTCMYYDLIEVMDLYTNLDTKGGRE